MAVVEAERSPQSIASFTPPTTAACTFSAVGARAKKDSRQRIVLGAPAGRPHPPSVVSKTVATVLGTRRIACPTNYWPPRGITRSIPTVSAQRTQGSSRKRSVEQVSGGSSQSACPASLAAANARIAFQQPFRCETVWKADRPWIARRRIAHVPSGGSGADSEGRTLCFLPGSPRQGPYPESVHPGEEPGRRTRAISTSAAARISSVKCSSSSDATTASNWSLSKGMSWT